MTRKQLIEQIRLKRTYLCIGLDTDIEKIPQHLLSFADPVFEFNRQIIDATKDLCVSYKINTAFYESRGIRGWESLEKTVDYIPSSHLTIADAKRGDIGNTSLQYAKAFFETLDFDALTVAPYMGEDSIRPFLQYKNKWTIVLGLTSNPGSRDFELQQTGDERLYEKVLKTVAKWGSTENLMFVIGATRAEELVNIRNLLPDHFFLVPGVGAQGGDLKEISEKAMNKDYGLLVNVSRSVIYAGKNEDFASAAKSMASRFREEMSAYIK
ncbi:MAG: orotidine-5'-phosphate decarboxylase [Chitinophagaceae bacterium]|nr:orotidine-5'-phosphate decarboxylase [Chitinophagaceae bacterium]